VSSGRSDLIYGWRLKIIKGPTCYCSDTPTENRRANPVKPSFPKIVHSQRQTEEISVASTPSPKRRLAFAFICTFAALRLGVNSIWENAAYADSPPTANPANVGESANRPAGDYLHERGGCPNAFRKFAESQKTADYTKITFFGGSITEGAGASKPELCYRELTMRQLRQDYPGAVLAENNSAIGGTGSWLGAFRTIPDALYGGAALVFVEFAVNDGDAPEQQVYASMEGIVRQIFARDSSTDVVFLYTLVKNHMEAYRQGKLPDRVAWHEKIAAHYGIPSVNMGQYAAEKILKGELTFDEFAKDGVHPTDRGYALYMEALRPFLAHCKAAVSDRPALHALPKAFGPAPMEHAQCVPYQLAKLDPAWKLGQPSPVDRFMHVLQSDRPGATLSLRFQGGQVGYFDAIGPESCDFEVSLDGDDWKPRPDFDIFCLNYWRPHARPIATGLDPQKWHELRLRIAEKQPSQSKGHAARIGWLLVDGQIEDPLQGLSPLARIDAIYAGMDPLDYTPPGDRWRNLDRTMQRLRDGGTLRIVMLGDSIIGDTSSSQYDLLLGRAYPKCKIEKITSLRGSTGCWWYKLDNHVEEYVLRHKPDLLMIGGISQRQDIDSIRAVIHQVRAKQSPEILLMTPAFGAMHDPHIVNWSFEIKAGTDDYRARLQRLAEEEKCGFIDMTGPWWRYVQQSGKCYGWFQRDQVHANERGFQILGRILEKFFAP
jgi:lysophospholipase L1-like esterase